MKGEIFLLRKISTECEFAVLVGLLCELAKPVQAQPKLQLSLNVDVAIAHFEGLSTAPIQQL
jgi:hypothetical protein